MINVCHLTPHLGGGVGRVLLGICGAPQENFHHEIVCLEYCNEHAASRAKTLGVPVSAELTRRELLERLAQADIVVIHWWNHPLLMELLVTVDLPAMRMLLWSHVAGHNAPQVFSRALIELPDLFVVASPYSLHAPALRGDEKHVRLVFTSAGTEHVSQIVPEEHDGFIIGYIGTVDYCKMHPDFLSMSLAADIPDAHFVVCGGDHHEEIGATAGDRFTFCGRVPDIRPYLSRFDVFGYPLRRDHYGTGEQVLIEAQAAGVVPVVLTGGAESYVVKHEETGLVVDEVDYPRALERLHTDPMLRARLSKAARKHALETFALERTVSSWHEVFSEALRLGKRQRKWSGQVASTGADLFLASVEKGAEQFSATIESAPLTFRSATRGSPFHYQTFFPEDPRLNRWCGRLQQGA